MESDDTRRTLTLKRAAADLANFKLILISMAGVGDMADDSGLIHDSPAQSDPYWRTDASFKGAKHEPETLNAAEIRARTFGKRICQQHVWSNVDHVGRCMSCGEPLS